ncbi:ABC transporter permease [Haloimpatiens sp. FM7330]|uniref:ABC transporter permease n=1 Tax=Haloimpatiens sp. FM7330 TaxID=3298610 RepID=UPI0036253E52
MKLFENFKMALESIKGNKLRSFLTMLGIIIGISSVITIVSLGEGAREAITGEFEKIGSATVNIKVDSSKAEKNEYIQVKDVKTIKDKVDSIKYVTPVVQKRGSVSSDIKNKTAFIVGGNTDLGYIENVEVLYGRFFNEREYVEGEAVVVLDKASAKALFGYEDVVGKSVQVGSASSKKKAKIVGVIKGFENPFMSTENTNMPVIMYTPITFLKNIYSNDFHIDTISVMAESKEESEYSGNAAINILESIHNNRGDKVYNAENVLKQLDQVNKVLGIFTAFIGAVAAISLLVGGIGVMNIMLVSVTERTREIGIRKAIGATTNTILIQFLTESVIISLIGGIIGMMLGILGAEIIGMMANITPSISIKVILGAILFSSAVGMFFGIYPAKKASNLNPIDALRYE